MSHGKRKNDPLLGAELDGRFRLDDVLGEGGMGRVYRATQLSVDRTVAVKVVLDRFADDPRVRERFFREARLISGFTHPNIVRLIDFGEDDDHDLLYLAMDFVDGVSLADVLDSGPLRWEVALRLAGQISGALVEAHAAGIVHRDLKPDNVLLSSSADGTVIALVLDFGVARPREVSIKLTDTGAVCGTPAYMAPEQTRSSDVEATADLYALGVMLYEMLAGALPFTGDTPMSVMLKKLQEPPPSLEDRALPGITFPPPVAQIVDRLLATDPVERPDDAVSLRDTLANALGGHDFTLRIDSKMTLVEGARAWRSTTPDEVGLVSTTPAGSTPQPPGADKVRDELPTEGDRTPEAPEPEPNAPRPTPDVPVPPPRPRSRLPWTAIAIAAGLVAVVGVLQFTGERTKPAPPNEPDAPSQEQAATPPNPVESPPTGNVNPPRPDPVAPAVRSARQAIIASRVSGKVSAERSHREESPPPPTSDESGHRESAPPMPRTDEDPETSTPDEDARLKEQLERLNSGLAE